MRMAAFLLLAVLVGSAPASAATVEQIVALSKAGVSESVILALIDRDKTIFALDSEQLVMLKREGVSEPVVLAMLKSGRAEADAAARAETEMRTANIAATTAPWPDVVVVGHEPDVPNSGGYGAVVQQDFLAVPYAVPYAAPFIPFAVPSRRGIRTNRRGVALPSADEALCVAKAASGPSVTSRGVGFVTPCQDAAQLHIRAR